MQVISDRAQKTILVAVDRWWVVPKYRCCYPDVQ